MTNIMLDLETWGKRPGCDIRSIGAVVFDPVAGTIGNHPMGIDSGFKFYIATDNPVTRSFDLPDGTELFRGYKYEGLHRDPETVKWWSEQSEDAQAAFENPVDLRKALEKFSSWICNLLPVAPPEGFTDLRLWANDPHFDVSILEAAYYAVGLPVPWHYRSPRSMKTVLDISGMTRDDMKKFDHGVKHNALDDAISQAMIVCECYRKLGLNADSISSR